MKILFAFEFQEKIYREREKEKEKENKKQKELKKTLEESFKKETRIISHTPIPLIVIHIVRKLIVITNFCVYN